MKNLPGNRPGRLSGGRILLAVFAFLLTAVTVRAAGTIPSELTLADRLACQAAIEGVYWDHRLWPAENSDPKPALEAVLSQAGIRTKVEESLRRSNALAETWHQEITGAMLQAEIERMAAETQEPEILAELWSALGGDPALVAECLARPALANRLLRNFHDGSPTTSQVPFDAWWAADRDRFPVDLAAPDHPYELPAITGRGPAEDDWGPAEDDGGPAGDGDSWGATPAIPFHTDGTVVWSGAEVLIFGGSGSSQGYRYDPATDTWDPMNMLNVPPGRREHSAVWTGTEMIVWGGCTGSNHGCDLKSGGRYNPVTNAWTATAIPANVAPRTRHGAVWTGEVMVVWGGCRYGAGDNCTIIPPEGGRYNPVTDTWQTTSTVDAPPGRTNPGMAWTGDTIIIWSGSNAPGGRYDPFNDSWEPVSSVNAPPGIFGSLVWTGTEAIAFGGCTGFPNCQTPEQTGGRYDPLTDTWTPTSLVNAPAGRWFHGAVWTGEVMIVFAGSNGPDYFNTGGRYDPATDTWTATSTVNAPSDRYLVYPVWTGEQMIVWGGKISTRTGGRYDPDTNTWTPMSDEDPGANRARHAAVWTGTEMIIWGGEVGVQHYNFGSVYDPILATWRKTAISDPLFGYTEPAAVWTGTEMLVWGGHGSNFVNSGGRYNPVTDDWTMMTFTNAPEGRVYHSGVWSGTEFIIWGGSTWFSEFDTDGARYNPATNTWSIVSAAGEPTGRRDHTAVWTGDVMVVWGGRGSGGEIGSGGRYDPETNTWAPVASAGAPSPRQQHTAVWTGSEMIVWGGGLLTSGSEVYNDGGRYDPTSNSWTPTGTDDAPEGRIHHVAVWTGQELIVWGGCAGSIDCWPTTSTGGRYDPASDSWTATNLFNAPERRLWHSGVWNGQALIVWGGLGDENGYTHTGGLYYPGEVDNIAPVAVDDSYFTSQSEFLSVPAPGVLGNDSDPDGDPFNAVLVSTTVHGALFLNGSGAFTYEPFPGFTGEDTFTYLATDGQANGNTATVTIVVEPVIPTATATPRRTPTPIGVTATPTPTPIGPTATPTNTPAAGVQTHIGDLDGSSLPNGPNRWNATVTIKVLDQNGSPVSGATVSGSWSNGISGNGNCTTNASGLCSITRLQIRNTSNSVTFTVTNVSKAGTSYNPAANTDPDGDSNGTVIVVNKP
jgi:N-acetylneuraminic acid mutarotase